MGPTPMWSLCQCPPMAFWKKGSHWKKLTFWSKIRIFETFTAPNHVPAISMKSCENKVPFSQINISQKIGESGLHFFSISVFGRYPPISKCNFWVMFGPFLGQNLVLGIYLWNGHSSKVEESRLHFFLFWSWVGILNCAFEAIFGPFRGIFGQICVKFNFLRLRWGRGTRF